MQSHPATVLSIASSLEKIVQRTAHIRKVKNRDEWFITDPLISHIQSGTAKGITGYRTGFYYEQTLDLFLFYLVHSPVIAKIFRDNFCVMTLRSVAISTSKFRSRHDMFWSSRIALKHGKPVAAIEGDTIQEFIEQIDSWEKSSSIKRDLFPPIGKSNAATSRAGHDFGLLLAENCREITDASIHELVNSSWSLFRLMYPTTPIQKRDASLARNLKAAKINKICEFSKIFGAENTFPSAINCQGAIEAAHIKPHSMGGTDKTSNGIWLCKLHHRITEGQIEGERTSVRIKQANA